MEVPQRIGSQVLPIINLSQDLEQIDSSKEVVKRLKSQFQKFQEGAFNTLQKKGEVNEKLGKQVVILKSQKRELHLSLQKIDQASLLHLKMLEEELEVERNKRKEAEEVSSANQAKLRKAKSKVKVLQAEKHEINVLHEKAKQASYEQIQVLQRNIQNQGKELEEVKASLNDTKNRFRELRGRFTCWVLKTQKLETSLDLKEINLTNLQLELEQAKGQLASANALASKYKNMLNDLKNSACVKGYRRPLNI